MLWNRKRFKQKAKKAFLKNYVYVVAVCFLVAFIGGEGSNSVKLITHYDSTKEQAATTFEQIKRYSDRDTIEAWFDNFDFFQQHKGKADDEILVSVSEDLSSNSTIFLRIYEAIRGTTNGNPEYIGVYIAAGSIVLLLFAIFVGNILIVGKRRFFLENRIEKDYQTPIRTILYSFKKELYVNTAKIMFFRDMFLFFWMFTIIGGIIKFYEYKAIPYILAGNTQLTRQEIFRLSKSMMKGYKWKFFILDLSFILWNILEAVTLGLVGILFVRPYQAATNAEAYIAIRNEAVALKKPYYECLKNPLFDENVKEYL